MPTYALDESTDISDASQLMVFIRTVNKNFDIFEDLLYCCPLRDTTRGIDIYNALIPLCQEKSISFEKLVSVCTDGARAMTSTTVGLVGNMKSFQNISTCFIIH